MNTSAEMIAPTFPHAALMPCAKALKRVGKTSAGYTYVVVLAPKLKKNWRRVKRTMKGTLPSVSNLPARIPRNRAQARKPWIWIHLRPSHSMVKAET